MALSPTLIDKVRKGKIVLFLGSGALYGANLPNKKIPLGNDLRDIICERFLNDSFKEADLAHVAAMAISQAGLFEVQDYIRDYFSELEPAAFHIKIPSFKWRAIFTTNYDLLVERCYTINKEPMQKLSLIVSNEDNFDETRVTNDLLPYVKLHGCVTRTHDSYLPLVLTTDQYNESFDVRKRLFNHLYELAYDNSIVFVGHSLLDHNVRAVLLSLEKECKGGQRHYLLKPKVDDIEKEFWGEKKITALDMTFSDFLDDIDTQVSRSDRLLSIVTPPSTHPIQAIFSKHVSPSEELIDFLTNQVDWVNADTPVSDADPAEFFKGVDQGWSPVAQNIAIPRNLQRHINERAIESTDVEQEEKSEFYVIKGEAGSGKTVLLRQIAWDIGMSALGVSLWVKPGCFADFDIIEEIVEKTDEHVYLFWDDAAINSIELNRFIQKLKKKDLPVSVFTAERYNEWNVRCEDLDELITDTFELRYLSENEIDGLVHQLEAHSSLGPNLKDKSHDQRCHELREIYGRQLLVALHEATMGEPFEDIIFNEYENIYPESAKRIYLTVCVLNRLRIPVRAGLISRIHQISFSGFQEQFYKPLERVVIVSGNGEQDIHYQARHSEIAEIVFRRALSNAEDRYQEYINIVKKLNVSFSTDRSSQRLLLRAKSLHDLFPEYEDVSAIYSHAIESNGKDPYILQQKANYERIRPNGSLDAALDLLQQAKELAPYDSSILHSLSVVWRDKSISEQDPRLRRVYRGEARGYLNQMVAKWGIDGYTSSSLIELSIEALNDLLNDDAATQYSIREAIRSVQQEITDNKRKFPTESQIHVLEAKFSELIDDHGRALAALEKSFEESDREPHLAIRLASRLLKEGEKEKAEEVFRQALDRRRADHKLNFHFAEFLRCNSDSSHEELMYFYRRAFTPGDGNYQAQFWYARYALNSTDGKVVRDAKGIFGALRKARVSHDAKVEIRDFDFEGPERKIFTGAIKTKRSSYGFVRVDGRGDEVFFPVSSVRDDLWDAIIEDDRVSFNLGYSFNGPVACQIRCE